MMFKFFRRIRQRLLFNGMLRKYLFYALGEILLVMFGILLAFQVNSWNEGRKRDIQEINLLLELKENLNEDIVDIDENVSFHRRAQHSAEYITDVINENRPYQDSLDFHFTNVLVVPMFLPTTTAYTNLKQNGTKLIRNDSLRYRIIELYEKKHVFINEWIGNQRTNMYDDVHDFYRKNFSDFAYFGKTHPDNYEDLLLNNEYKNYLNQQVYFSKYSEFLYNNCKDSTLDIINMIDKEVKKRT